MKKLAVMLTLTFIAITAISPALMAKCLENMECFENLPYTGGNGFNGKEGSNRCEERVVVELVEEGGEWPERLSSLGVVVEAQRGRLVQLKVSSNAIAQITLLDNVKRVRKPSVPIPLRVESEGVQAVGANLLHNLGLLGRNVKVAVLDLGFNIYDPEISENIQEYRSFRFDGDITGGSEENVSHGTACAEIVVDMAPESELYLYNFETDVEYLMAVDHAVSRNVDIISVSVGFLNVGPYDGSNHVAQAADEAQAHGIFFVSAAGNEARSHWSGVFTDNDNDGLHNFTPDDEDNDISVERGSLLTVFLSWEDWPSTGNDYDLYLYGGPFNTILAASDEDQNGSQPPIESITYHAVWPGTYRIVIRKTGSAAPMKMHLFSLNLELEHYVQEGSIVPPGDSSGAFTVGAVNLDGEVEPYSSRGPTVDGRVKPDITAPDGVVTWIYGGERFYGTSASAPHVAGAAALLLEAEPNLTPQDLKRIMEETAVDQGASGKDNEYGAGRLDVYAAYSLLKGFYGKAKLTVHAHPAQIRYPTEPSSDLTITVNVSYVQNGEILSEERSTPFQISVDQGSTVNITVRAPPAEYRWVEWENYGYWLNSSTNLSLKMDGDRVLIAYLEPLAAKAHRVITIHAHPITVQYPEEPSEELNITVHAFYTLNETSRSAEFTVGPRPAQMQVDADSSLNLTISHPPRGYKWLRWKIHGDGESSSQTLTISANTNQTVIAYFEEVKPSQGDFTITVTPQVQVYIPGQPVNYTISTNPINNFNDTITLTLEPIPGFEALLQPSTLMPGQKSVLTIFTDEKSPPQMVTITVKASGGGREHLVQAALQRWIIPWIELKELACGSVMGIIAILIIKKAEKRRLINEMNGIDAHLHTSTGQYWALRRFNLHPLRDPSNLSY
ncbi:MAG: S8 family serine peptidase [Candidatus Bathyarchaeia archaeon]